jgi:hypothetical protein
MEMKEKRCNRVPVQLNGAEQALVERLAAMDKSSAASILAKAVAVGLPKVQAALEALYQSVDEIPPVGQAAVVAETPVRYSARKKGVA